MKTHFKTSLNLYLILILLGALTACYQKNSPVDPPEDKPVLTIEEDLLAKGYEQTFRWTLFDANRALFELTNLQVEVSGPNSQWGTITPSFPLSFSTDEGDNWQDTLLVLQKPPVCIKNYAFYYQENQIFNNQDKGTVVVYEKP